MVFTNLKSYRMYLLNIQSNSGDRPLMERNLNQKIVFSLKVFKVFLRFILNFNRKQ